MRRRSVGRGGSSGHAPSRQGLYDAARGCADKFSPADQALVKRTAREVQLEQREPWNKAVADYTDMPGAEGVEITRRTTTVQVVADRFHAPRTEGLDPKRKYTSRNASGRLTVHSLFR